jgi:hypothetical protein
MDEDKRKRLEILKMKNQSLKNELSKISSSEYASNASSNIMAPSVAMLKKESMKVDLNLDEIKKNAGLLKNVLQKYRTENLSTFFMSETILGMTPEAYEEGVQCDIEKELKNDSDNEEQVKHSTPVSYRKSIMPARNKSSMTSWAQKLVESTVNYGNEDSNQMKVIPEEKEENKGASNFKSGVKGISEEMRRQILNSHELNEFLSCKSKYVERVLFNFLSYHLGSWRKRNF